MTGVRVAWECAVEVEVDKVKRQWFRTLPRLTFLGDDVSNISKDEPMLNHMSYTFEYLPQRLLCYTFGYSRKDLRTLNSISSS